MLMFCLQVDAIETRSHYQLHVALPGITKGASAGLVLSSRHSITCDLYNKPCSYLHPDC